MEIDFVHQINCPLCAGFSDAKTPWKWNSHQKTHRRNQQNGQGLSGQKAAIKSRVDEFAQ